MKKAIATMMLLAGGLFAAPHVRFGIGVGIGVPAPVAVVRPACPGPGYTWTDGYYAPDGVWIAGYWAPPVVHVSPAVRFGVRPGFRGYDHFRR
ncbi:MAG TPA: hypothetical protein VMB03_12115 [Bryobacteraceae bacterium]|nr:hypothetical protein [Bryobacteraceae bacterium]